MASQSVEQSTSPEAVTGEKGDFQSDSVYLLYDPELEPQVHDLIDEEDDHSARIIPIHTYQQPHNMASLNYEVHPLPYFAGMATCLAFGLMDALFAEPVHLDKDINQRNFPGPIVRHDPGNTPLRADPSMDWERSGAVRHLSDYIEKRGPQKDNVKRLYEEYTRGRFVQIKEMMEAEVAAKATTVAPLAEQPPQLPAEPRLQNASEPVVVTASMLSQAATVDEAISVLIAADMAAASKDPSQPASDKMDAQSTASSHTLDFEPSTDSPETLASDASAREDKDEHTAPRQETCHLETASDPNNAVPEITKHATTASHPSRRVSPSISSAPCRTDTPTSPTHEAAHQPPSVSSASFDFNAITQAPLFTKLTTMPDEMGQQSREEAAVQQGAQQGAEQEAQQEAHQEAHQEAQQEDQQEAQHTSSICTSANTEQQAAILQDDGDVQTQDEAERQPQEEPERQPQDGGGGDDYVCNQYDGYHDDDNGYDDDDEPEDEICRHTLEHPLNRRRSIPANFQPHYYYNRLQKWALVLQRTYPHMDESERVADAKEREHQKATRRYSEPRWMFSRDARAWEDFEIPPMLITLPEGEDESWLGCSGVAKN